MTSHRFPIGRDGRRRGQALVEFALVLPIFLILLFGIIDFGRYVYAANALNNGVREGARYGSVTIRPSPLCDGLSRDACVTAVVKSMSWGVPASSITTTVSCERVVPNASTPTVVPISSCRTNDLLHVQSQATFTLVTPLIAQFLGGHPIVGEALVTVNQ
jgi:Flp pilus assembly protein TadG